MQAHMTADLVIAALQQAVTHRKPPVGLIHHSDQGSQYTSEVFKQVTEQQGIILSMSGVGNCYDNAAAESFFHTLKSEHVYFERYETQEQAKQSIFEYITVFYIAGPLNFDYERYSTEALLPKVSRGIGTLSLLIFQLFCSITVKDGTQRLTMFHPWSLKIVGKSS